MVVSMRNVHYAKSAYFPFKEVRTMSVDVGGLLRKIRKKKGWSQEEAAFQMHTTQSTISRLEKNLVACEVGFLLRFGKVTNCEDLVIASLFSLDVIIQASTIVPLFVNFFTHLM